ncbi:putative glycosyltransferase [Rubidibacter lacunae KORDI 51-2]|uniref:Putative glycosyltransferase n=1 Tax=Rubidibacter lacunae KORDI 51-2 TaxID=582515 RepID=U5DSA9_9CHRO|nr:glycosyltransferase family 2 protein [Rubidibacter lacunae]ERN42560.1 putative glycosyltransferase [Rubidibacter lacunae KORDI 51-2]
MVVDAGSSLQLLVVVLNYRTPALTIDCLASLDGQLVGCKHAVVVVDNASGDGSLQEIERAIALNNWQAWVRVLPSSVNGGFSAGNNLGIQSARAEAYLLLNSDTIVRPGAISSLLRELAAHPAVGIVSPRLEWPDATPQISCFRYRSPGSEAIAAAQTGSLTKLLLRFDMPLPVTDNAFEPEWTSFACVLIRRAVVERVGLMDEGYFMYCDDIDYCRRTRALGWTIRYCPEARVVHLRGGSGPVKQELAARKRPQPYVYASRSRYFAKFYGGRRGLIVANACWLLGRSVSLFRELLGRQTHLSEATARDIWMYWRDPLRPYKRDRPR